jgi:hypothetical protein
MRDRAQAIVLAAFFAATSAACEPAQAPAVPTVSLRVAGAPSDAVVIIDENALGTFDFVAAHGVALPPGKHRITVHASGYFPWDREVEAKLGEGPIRLQVALVPIPD